MNSFDRKRDLMTLILLFDSFENKVKALKINVNHSQYCEVLDDAKTYTNSVALIRVTWKKWNGMATVLRLWVNAKHILKFLNVPLILWGECSHTYHSKGNVSCNFNWHVLSSNLEKDMVCKAICWSRMNKDDERE